MDVFRLVGRLARPAVAAWGCTSALAAPVVLDFETPSTGSTLTSAPLVTTAGTVTLTGGGTLLSSGGPTGRGLLHLRTTVSPFAQLDFSFEVASLSFDFNGSGSGAFLAEVLSADGSVIDSFFVQETSCVASCFDASVALSGPGIRSFRFRDTDLAGSFVDNLALSTQRVAVPEPASMALAGLALAGMALLRRAPAPRTRWRGAGGLRSAPTPPRG